MTKSDEKSIQDHIKATYDTDYLEACANVIITYEVDTSYHESCWNKGVALAAILEKLNLRLVKA